MRKKILIVLAALAALVIVFLIIVATRPPEFRVTRSATIGTAPAEVFPHVNEIRKWDTWSPWAKLDPNAKYSFEGPAAGTGAAMTWAGNNEVGEGRMTITESRPSELVRFRLDFYKPMAGTSDTEFTFKPQGNQTEVTWTMTGTNNFIGKAMCMVMNMDKMMGGRFEQGLASLKSMAESATKK